MDDSSDKMNASYCYARGRSVDLHSYFEVFPTKRDCAVTDEKGQLWSGQDLVQVEPNCSMVE